jgi:hypothetical protein
MRADTHNGSELDALQTKAGYIDAGPLTTNSRKSPLRRTAGPYIGSEAGIGRFPYSAVPDIVLESAPAAL